MKYINKIQIAIFIKIYVIHMKMKKVLMLQYMIEKKNIIIIICLYAQKIVYSMNMIL